MRWERVVIFRWMLAGAVPVLGLAYLTQDPRDFRDGLEALLRIVLGFTLLELALRYTPLGESDEPA